MRIVFSGLRALWASLRGRALLQSLALAVVCYQLLGRVPRRSAWYFFAQLGYACGAVCAVFLALSLFGEGRPRNPRR